MLRGQLVSTIFAGLLLLLVLVNILLSFGNQSLQSELAERQQEIGQGIQLEGLQRQVVAVLAEMAVKTNDAQLKDLLAKSGFTLDRKPEGAGQAK
jgi:predicted Holliday junction resolvase-like endonuclease